MKKSFAVAWILAALSFVPAFAVGKTVYVDMEKLFNEYYKTTNENIQFETQRKSFLDGMALLREEYQNSLKEHQKTKAEAENVLLGAEARKAASEKQRLLEDRLRQKQQEIMQYRETRMREIEGRQQQTIEALTTELVQMVQRHAKEKGYGAVLETSGRTMNRVPVVLVHPEEDDITATMIQQANAGHEKERELALKRLEELRKKSSEAMRALQNEK